MIDEAEIHRMANSADVEERRVAVKQLRDNFAFFSDKPAAWSDLIRLTQDEDSDVRLSAAHVLGSVFSAVPNKNSAWSDLIRLIRDEGKSVRGSAADALGPCFSAVPDKPAAWSDLIRLTRDEDKSVRGSAAKALGLCFSAVPDKPAARSDLIRLTQDKHQDVRMYAYHSLGSASVYKATATEDEGKFRGELKKAIDYFESSSQESIDEPYNPAQFCLPFYRSYYAVISRQQEAEATKYFDEAKNVALGSESREMLLKSVENLANALKEVHKSLEFGKTQEHLKACRQYCDHTAELVDSAREKSPVAAAVIRRGIPIVGVKVKKVLAEIQENVEALCKQANDTEFKELSRQIQNIGQNISKIRDPIGLEKAVSEMCIPLSAMCEKMPEKGRGDACKLLKQINDERDIGNKLESTTNLLRKISNEISKSNIAYEFHKSAEQCKNEAKLEIGGKNVALIRAASENYGKASDQYEKCGTLVDSYITKALSKSILVSIETDNIQILKYLDEAIIEIDKAIKVAEDKDVKQLQGLRFEYLARKNIWFAIISKDNTSNQDNILFDIVDCFKNASKMFEHDGNIDYAYKCNGCACLYESLSYLSKGIKSGKVKDFWTSYKSFKKSKEYYSSAKSNIGVNIIDKIGELITLLKKFIDGHSDCIENGKTPKIEEWDMIFHKIDDILEEITVPGLKKLCAIYLWDETIANIDSIKCIAKTEKMRNKQNIRSTKNINLNHMHILHLSDIHLGTENEAHKYCTQLETDLIKELDIKQIKYMIILGDIANRSEKNEYKAAVELIDGLIERFHIDKNCIIIVPGNHDLNWEFSKDAYRNNFIYTNELPSNLPAEMYIPAGEEGVRLRDEELYKKRFANFNAHFYEKVFGTQYPLDYAEQGILHPYPDERILFLALNSCWEIDHYKPHHERASINMDALSNALRELNDDEYNDWLKIAVWHHPVTGSEMMKNVEFLQQLAIHQFQICMHGHIHEASEDFYKYDDKRRMHIVGAGTFGAPKREQVTGIPLQYNLLTLDPENKKITVNTRMKEKSNGAWEGDSRWGSKNDKRSWYGIELK